jgi:hypothetical protein
VRFLKPQGRFKHLFKPENASILEAIQRNVDKNWDLSDKNFYLLGFFHKNTK